MKASRKPPMFNILITGHANTGKSTLIKSLTQHLSTTTQTQPAFTTHPQIEIRTSTSQRVTVTLTDTPGVPTINLENDISSIVNTIGFIEQQFQKTLVEETKLRRAKILDEHVHVSVFLLNPVSLLAHEGLTESIPLNQFSLSLVDRLFLIGLCGKTNVIVAIGKVDTVTKRDFTRIMGWLNTQLEDLELVFEDFKSESVAKVYGVFNGESDDSDQPTDKREYMYGTVEGNGDLVELMDALIESWRDLVDGVNQDGYDSYRERKLTSLLPSQQ